MERAEAEAIYEQGREAVVAALLVLSAQAAALEALVRKQEERIVELEPCLSRNSKNPALPPSQDPPEAPPRPRRTISGHKRGAQRGHKGRGRRLAPSETADEIVEYWPEFRYCGHRFTEVERRPARAPLRHQVAGQRSPVVIGGWPCQRAAKLRDSLRFRARAALGPFSDAGNPALL